MAAMFFSAFAAARSGGMAAGSRRSAIQRAPPMRRLASPLPSMVAMIGVRSPAPRSSARAWLRASGLPVAARSIR